LYNDSDWDYTDIFNLLQFKLERTEKHIRYEGSSVNRNDIANEIKEAVRMLKVIKEDDFGIKFYDEIDSKYGNIIYKNNRVFREFETEENREQIRKDIKNASIQEEEERRKAYKEFFDYLSNHIRNWWD
jgi:pyridoxine/pyridoxamine 5'-phosphate oxidase